MYQRLAGLCFFHLNAALPSRRLSGNASDCIGGVTTSEPSWYTAFSFEEFYSVTTGKYPRLNAYINQATISAFQNIQPFLVLYADMTIS